MLFGAVVDDTHAHLVPSRNPELGNAGAVKLGAQAQFGVQAKVIVAVWLVTFWHTNTPAHSVAAGERNIRKGGVSMAEIVDLDKIGSWRI